MIFSSMNFFFTFDYMKGDLSMTTYQRLVLRTLLCILQAIGNLAAGGITKEKIKEACYDMAIEIEEELEKDKYSD